MKDTSIRNVNLDIQIRILKLLSAVKAIRFLEYLLFEFALIFVY